MTGDHSSPLPKRRALERTASAPTALTAPTAPTAPTTVAPAPAALGPEAGRLLAVFHALGVIRSNPKFRAATYTFLSKIRPGVETLCGSEFGPLQVFLLAELLGPGALSAMWVNAAHIGTDIALHLGPEIHSDHWRGQLQRALSESGPWDALVGRVTALCKPPSGLRAAAATGAAERPATAVVQLLRDHLQLRHADPALLAPEHRREIESRTLAPGLADCVSEARALQIKQAAYADELSSRLGLQRKFAVQRVVAHLPRLVDLIFSETSALKRPSFAWTDFVARLHKRHPLQHRLTAAEINEQLELLLQVAPVWVRRETLDATHFVQFDKAVPRKQVLERITAFEQQLADEAPSKEAAEPLLRSAQLIETTLQQLENLQESLRRL